MKISIALRAKYEYRLDFNVIGSGKIDDPFVLSPPKYDYYDETYDRRIFSLKILDSKSYAEINNYDLRTITLINCNNLTISDSVIRTVKLINCSNILIKDDVIRKRLILESCNYVDLIDSKIHVFEANTSEDILVSKCEFDRIKKRTYSSSFTMEDSKIRGLKSYFQSCVLHY